GDHALELLLVLVVLQRREVPLVLLLLGHRFHARALLGLDAGLFDLAVADRIEPRGFFLLALLFIAAAVLLGLEARSFVLTCATLGVCLCLDLGLHPTPLVVVLLLDAVLLEIHQLLERERTELSFCSAMESGLLREFGENETALRGSTARTPNSLA